MPIGDAFLHALCNSGDASIFFRYNLTEELFFGEEKVIFSFIKDHAVKYLTLPHPDTLAAYFPNVEISVEPPKFYLDKVQERFKHKKLNSMLMQCSTLMSDQQVTDVVTLLHKTLNEITLFDQRTHLIDFGKQGHDLIMQEVQNVQKGILGGVNFGWPYLDTMVNGLQGGEIVCILGKPASGKTYLTLYSALNAWKKQGKNVMFVSMEMKAIAIAKRLAALYSKISITDIKKGFFAKIPVDEQQLLSSKLKELQEFEPSLSIIDGHMSATPEEIFTLATTLKPNVIFIDGAYLLQNTNKRLDRYMKVAENLESLQRYSHNLNIPTICSFQFNRTGNKKKKSEEVDLTDAGYTHVIGEISDIALGLFEEETVETLMSRLIRVLKGREGEIGSFRVNWDFQNMNFDEIDKESLTKHMNEPLNFI